MKKRDEKWIKKQEELQGEFALALAYYTVDDARKVLKKGFKPDPNEIMPLIMWHCKDLDYVILLKELGYDFKDDQRCLEEFTKYAALKPEIAQYMIDNGAVISWKAIQQCAKRWDLDVLKILVNNKKEFFPVD